MHKSLWRLNQALNRRAFHLLYRITLMQLKLRTNDVFLILIAALCFTAQPSDGTESLTQDANSSDFPTMLISPNSDPSDANVDITNSAAVAARRDLDPGANGSIQDWSDIKPPHQ